METLGLNLCESKAMLKSVQDFVVAQQAAGVLSSGAAAQTAEIAIPPRAAGRSK
jgi:hypothetical protein